MIDREEIQTILKNVTDHQELLEASFKPTSELLFTKYKSLLAAGFNEEQAMQIITSRGLNA